MEEFNEDEELERIKAKKELSENEVSLESLPENYSPAETQIKQGDQNPLVSALINNEAAINMAKERYADLKNQKSIAKKMGAVVTKKTNADIETADLRVSDQRLQNKAERARQKNELLKCQKERKLLIQQSKHELQMQKFRHRKEKYGDLLLRHCRKKAKNEEGKWEFLSDEKGNAIINMPNGFVLFWLILFDSLVMFLNQMAEVFGSLNKVVWKVIWVAFILVILLIEPIRTWLLGIIGIRLS